MRYNIVFDFGDPCFLVRTSLAIIISQIFLIALDEGCFAQTKRIHSSVDLETSLVPAKSIPFYMRSGSSGSSQFRSLSSALNTRIERRYQYCLQDGKRKWLDWSAAVEARLSVSQGGTTMDLLAGYLSGSIGAFELKAGRDKESMGLTGDSALTSGSFAISGNALGIPKVQLSIPQYRYVPFLDSLISVKGNFGHGWMGSLTINDTIGLNKYSLVSSANTYFHQKSFYARFGKPSWKISLIGGMNHQAMWGDESKIYGRSNTLSWQDSYLYVVTGRVDYVKNIGKSKVGNHLGSIDYGVEYTLKGASLFIYRQQFYDVGALYYLANALDGLTGITFHNTRKKSSNAIRINSLLFEFLYTKNQAGELWSRKVPSGDEDYYNHYVYRHGWSYRGKGLGTPFISSKVDVRDGLARMPNEQFVNNRVIVFHSGVNADILDCNVVLKGSYSRNYGTYGTSPIGHSDNTGAGQRKPRYGLFGEMEQVSFFAQGSKKLRNGYGICFQIAGDMGSLLNKSFGTLLAIQKSF